MFINSSAAEENAVLNAAYAICAAARTAPKARGEDYLQTAVLTGEEKDAVAREMRRLCEVTKAPFFERDADSVDKSTAIVLAGVTENRRGLGSICRLCGFEDCQVCAVVGAQCVYSAMDLGIALGSAVALITDLRIDNRIMFTVGQAALSLNLLNGCVMVMGIPLSASAKSPFFDRK